MSLGADIGRLIREAREVLARGEVQPLIPEQVPALEALERAAQESRALLADALEFLDSMTPGDWTFLSWCDAAEWEHPDDPQDAGIYYRYDRSRSEVFDLMAAAAQRALRLGDGMARWLESERVYPFTPEQLRKSEDAA